MLKQNSLTKVLKKKHQQFKKYLETRQGKDYEMYTRVRNQAKWACRYAVREYERKVAANSKENPKAFYAYVRKKLKTKESLADLKTQHGIALSVEEKANALNDFFYKCTHWRKLNTCPSPTIKSPVLSSRNVAISEGQIKKELQTLKTGKAQVPDSLHPRISKELADCLCKSLTLIFKHSLEPGELPACWKTAEVTAIFKKVNRSDPENYRPVSLTCIICKVLEKLVRDILVNHMTINNLFYEYQHGFLKGRSCITNLRFILEELTKARDHGVTADVVYLDFAKAFDSVPNKRLIPKLWSYQIEGKILFESNWKLFNRKKAKGCSG